MRRLQIMLDEDLYAELERQSRAERRSMAALVRDSLRRSLRRLPPLEEDPLWGMVGASDAEPVEDVDEYLIGLKEAKMKEAGFVELRP
jgi:Ribbon-helix-helix protein, copG family